jgi:ABC-2 type transport system ATP-binding protein
VFRGLSKSFGPKKAVTDVSLAVPRGTFTGLVGPNGAGKTTLLRMVTGLQRPDAGSVLIDGVSVWPDPAAIRSVIGVLPDDLHLFERLSGRELLSYIGLLRRIPPAEVQRRADQLCDVLGFGDKADELVADYSTGMRKKIGLGAALLHAPRILFLDEPFESVDPISVRVIQDVLRAYQVAGGTVLLSSHVMDTVERLCSHVAILHEGQIVSSGTIDEVSCGASLEEVFFQVVSGTTTPTGTLEWFRADARDALDPADPLDPADAQSHRDPFDTGTFDEQGRIATGRHV